MNAALVSRIGPAPATSLMAQVVNSSLTSSAGMPLMHCFARTAAEESCMTKPRLATQSIQVNAVNLRRLGCFYQQSLSFDLLFSPKFLSRSDISQGSLPTAKLSERTDIVQANHSLRDYKCKLGKDSEKYSALQGQGSFKYSSNDSKISVQEDPALAFLTDKWNSCLEWSSC